jgi:hypothetical protein
MFREWYHTKVIEANKSCRFGSIALIPAAMIAATVTWWVTYILLSIGPKTVFNISGESISVVCWIMLPILFVWHFKVGERVKEEHGGSGKPLTTTELAATRYGGETWMKFIVDPNSGIVLLNFLAAWFITAPKLLSLALILHERVARLSGSQADTCLPALRHLFEAAGSVPITELAEQGKKKLDPIEVMRTLTALDGIVTETESVLSLSIAPRVVREFEDWSIQKSKP